MKKLILILFFMSVIKISESQTYEKQTENNNKFTFELFSLLNQENTNVFLSPFSVSAAMAMAYDGARGKTRKEMSEVLHFPDDANTINGDFKDIISDVEKTGNPKGYIFKVANSIFAQEDFNFLHSYFNNIRKYYNAKIEGVNFKTEKDREAAIKKINNWVAEKTENKIKNILNSNSVDGDTKAVLVNAVYFLASWDKAFNEKATQKDIFYALNGKIQKEFMYVNSRMKYYGNEKYRMLEIPYKEKRASMIVVLPEKNSDFQTFKNDFGYDEFKKSYKNCEYKNISLALPKFKIEYKSDLVKVLYSAGIKQAFTNRADFTGMTCKKELKIDKVIHQTFIDVNENGTEAAAATAVVMTRITSVNPSEKIVFKANRPFVYLIKDNKTGSILFIGQLVN